MGLVERFQALFRPRIEEVAPATRVAPPARPSALARLLSEESDRRAVVLECRAMYANDPRARGVIRSVASDATRGGFDLVVEGPRAAQALEIAEEMLERTKFWKQLQQFARMLFRDGDLFLELAADGQGNIVEITRKPSLEVMRLSDEFDRFTDPRRAFAWSDALWGGWTPGRELPPGAVTFAEWQIIHARWDFDGDGRYGAPMFASARSQAKRMREGELDVAIRRKTRAGMKYVHTLEGASEGQIEAYRLRNQDALNDPFAAVADFFSNQKGGIEAIQGDATLSEIEDVVHHIRTWWLAAPKPMSLLGYGQDLNRDVLEQQQKAYNTTAEELSTWLSEEIVQPLIERQWLLRGIWPASLKWSIEWMHKQPVDAAGLQELASAVAGLRAAGIMSDETILRLVSRFLPDFDVEAELTALQAQMQDEVARQALAAADEEPEEEPDGVVDDGPDEEADE